VKTIFGKSKWKLVASLGPLSLIEWEIQVNISSIINQLWEKNFQQRHFLEFSHSLCPKETLKSGDIRIS